MIKSHIKRMFSYFSRIYYLGEEVKRLKDGRMKPQVETSVIAFIVLFAFICGLKSFNRLERWMRNKKFKRLFPRGTRLPRIDTIRRSLSSFDIDSLNDMHERIVKWAKGCCN